MFRFLPPTHENQEDDEDPFNMAILDAILDDDEETFISLISQKQSISNNNVNYEFKLTKYKLVEFINVSPPIASVCAFFGAEKCFSALVILIPEGIRSKDFGDNRKCGIPLISYAAAGGSIQIFRQLYEAGYELDETDTSGQAPCHYATIFGRIDILKYIISKGIDVFDNLSYFTMRPLHIACFYGYLDIVKFLCEKVAKYDQLKFINVNSVIQDRNQTPLYYAAAGGHVEIVKYLLTIDLFYKHHINLVDGSGETPLNAAIVRGNFDCVVALIKTGKCRMINPGRERVPLVDAAFFNHVDILKYLLKNGASLTDATCKGTDCISGAVNGNAIDVLEYLYNEGFFNDISEDRLYFLVKIAFLLDCMGSINFFNEKFDIDFKKDCDEYFRYAIKNNSIDAVDFLIEKKCTFDDLENFENNDENRSHFLKYLKYKFKDPNGKEQERERKILESLDRPSLD